MPFLVDINFPDYIAAYVGFTSPRSLKKAAT